MADPKPLPEVTPTPGDVVEAAAKKSSKLAKAATVATTLIQHRQMVVAAMEMLRDKAALSEEEEVKLLSAYEQGTAVAKSAISDVLERLQKANLGEVVIQLKEVAEGRDLSPEGVRDAARPYISMAKQELLREAQPYLERARQRLQELKVLEEPTLRRLEEVGKNLRAAGHEVALGLKGAGKEAADELVRRGKRWWMSPETEEMEREFFDWAVRTVPKAEASFVRFLYGSGAILVLCGLLLAAQQFDVLRDVVLFGSMFLLFFVGILALNAAWKLNKAMKTGRTELERLARMEPGERRTYLARRWAERAQQEGTITADEARTVIEETLRAEEAMPPPSPGVSSKA